MLAAGAEDEMRAAILHTRTLHVSNFSFMGLIYIDDIAY